jgi:ATP-binding cassette subfamily C (CFTR/MRP) protein 1
MTRQALWLEGIERRIAATTAMLNSMKGVKMGGLTEVLRDDLQQLRVDELNISKKFRKLLIWTMGFCELYSENLGFSVLTTVSLYLPDSIAYLSLRCVFHRCPKRK